jgi:tRNA nucleotidyltransferase (CCA-adding enzyme)
MYTKIIQEALKKYESSTKERKIIENKTETFLEVVRELIKKENIKATVTLGGSAAKGTFLAHDFDCDIFVRFNYKEYKDKNISKLLEKALTPLKVTQVHGSRDYFQKKDKGIDYEIVPVLHVTKPSEAKNVTDMSPLHVEWVQKKIKTEKRKEVILTKLFCKANNVYGAESYINGFSGHVLDILIAKYGSFLAFVKNAAEWKEKTIIDVEKHYKSEESILKKLNKAKLQSPLIVVDPVQPERNAAAAVSFEKYEKCIAICKLFLEDPSLQFFQKKPFSLTKLEKEMAGKYPEQGLHTVRAMPFEGKADIVGTKLFKLHTFIREELKRHTFIVWDAGWHWEKEKEATFWYVIDKDILPETATRMGPPLKTKAAVLAFKKKHGKNCYEKEQRLYAAVDREFRNPETLLKAIAQGEYAREKALRVEV